MGASELRTRLDISREQVYRLVIGDDFPRCYADLAQGKLWLTEDVDAWLSAWTPGQHDSAPVNAATNRHPLMGAHEIRARLGGISRQRAYQITLRGDFPEPVAQLMQGKVWLAAEIEEWHHLHRSPERV